LYPTRAGWIYFALCFGIGFAALNTGNNLLYLVLALLLAFLVLSGLLSESALRGIRVRRLPPAEIFAGEPAFAALEIENAQARVPAFAVVVEDLDAGGSGRVSFARAFALHLPARAREARSVRWRVERRGWLELRGFRVSTRFPFGLFSKALWLEAPARVLVYPGLGPADATAPREPGSGSQRSTGLHEVADEASGLRAFSAGDTRRRIHWRASLRRGEILVRDADRLTPRNAWVRLVAGAELPPEEIERRIAHAARQVVDLLEAGFAVGLQAGPLRFEPGHGPAQRARLLRELALFEPAMAPPAREASA
jgi:uncharacterized protein (DUF58 family)